MNSLFRLLESSIVCCLLWVFWFQNTYLKIQSCNSHMREVGGESMYYLSFWVYINELRIVVSSSSSLPVDFINSIPLQIHNTGLCICTMFSFSTYHMIKTFNFLTIVKRTTVNVNAKYLQVEYRALWEYDWLVLLDFVMCLLLCLGRTSVMICIKASPVCTPTSSE